MTDPVGRSCEIDRLQGIMGFHNSGLTALLLRVSIRMEMILRKYEGRCAII